MGEQDGLKIATLLIAPGGVRGCAEKPEFAKNINDVQKANYANGRDMSCGVLHATIFLPIDAKS
jgi:hypothetical protein